jgi:uncharacterized DUF497 family protein
MATDGYEWDPRKAANNRRKHGVDFDDAVIALEDPMALTMLDPDSNGEARFVSMGRDPMGRLLVTIFTPRGRLIRVISSRRATPIERRTYGERT